MEKAKLPSGAKAKVQKSKASKEGKESKLDRFFSRGRLDRDGRLLIREVGGFKIYDPVSESKIPLIDAPLDLLAIDVSNVFFRITRYAVERESKENTVLLAKSDKFTGETQVLLTKENMPKVPTGWACYPPSDKWYNIKIGFDYAESNQDYQDSAITHVFLLSEYKLIVVDVNTAERVVFDLSQWKIAEVQPIEGWKFLGLTEYESEVNASLYLFQITDLAEGEFTSKKVSMPATEYGYSLFPYSKKEVGVIWTENGTLYLINGEGKRRKPYGDTTVWGGEESIYYITSDQNIVHVSITQEGGTTLVFGPEEAGQAESSPLVDKDLVFPGDDWNLVPLSRFRFIGGRNELSLWSILPDRIDRNELESGIEIVEGGGIDVLHGSLAWVPYRDFSEAVLFVAYGRDGNKYLYSLDIDDDFKRQLVDFRPVEFLRMEDSDWEKFARRFLTDEITQVPSDIAGIIAKFL